MPAYRQIPFEFGPSLAERVLPDLVRLERVRSGVFGYINMDVNYETMKFKDPQEPVEEQIPGLSRYQILTGDSQ